MFEALTYNFRLWAQSSYDKEYLRGVKTGFGGSGVGISLETVLVLFMLLAGLILLLLLLRRFIKPADMKLIRGSVDLILSPQKIREILDRSVDLRSIYEMEIYDDKYQEFYKGPVIGINDHNEIEMEMTSFLDPDLDFWDKYATVIFRISRQGKQEFYQFETICKGLGRSQLSNYKERIVRLAMPEQMRLGQKRRHIRVTPSGFFKFKINILGGPDSSDPIPLRSFTTLHVAEIDNISIGGLQAVVTARMIEMKIKGGQIVFLQFKPPLRGLNQEDLPASFIIKAKVISVQRVARGRRVMSAAADEMTVGPNQIRLMFLSKGQVNKKERTVTFPEATAVSFDDIGHWIQAYQRYRIREAKGTTSHEIQVKNIYPNKPPEVKPKYPSEPLKRGRLNNKRSPSDR